MKRIPILLILCAFIYACETPDPVPEDDFPSVDVPPVDPPEDKLFEPIELTEAEEEISVGINDLGFSIFHQNLSQDKDYLLSPLSASVALAIASDGTGGNTRDQIIEALGFKDKPVEVINDFYLKMLESLCNADNRVKLAIANSAWNDKKFLLKQDYVTKLESVYSASVNCVDFSDPETIDIINEWCANHTNNKIVRFIENLDPTCKLMLLNALYFQGSWTAEFEEPSEELYTHSDGTTSFENMLAGNFNLRYSESPYFKCVEIPYGNGAFTMNLLLPLYGDTPDPWAEFTEDAVCGLFEEMSYHKVDIKFPCFNINAKYNLNESLKQLGIVDAFDAKYADFSGMSDSPLYLQSLQQAVYINVDQKGTEAAAVTGNGMCSTNIEQQVKHASFVADRPFVFIVRESSTGLILFMGYKS